MARHRIVRHVWHHITHRHRSYEHALGFIDLCWVPLVPWSTIQLWYTPTGDSISIHIPAEAIDLIFEGTTDVATARIKAYDHAVKEK